eukprot:2177182-Amphidinium_carterae.2
MAGEPTIVVEFDLRAIEVVRALPPFVCMLWFLLPLLHQALLQTPPHPARADTISPVLHRVM